MSLRTILPHELTARRQLIQPRVRIDGGPGKMVHVSERVADLGVNVRTVHHLRADGSLSVGESLLILLVETSGESHASEIIRTIEDEGYDVDRVDRSPPVGPPLARRMAVLRVDETYADPPRLTG